MIIDHFVQLVNKKMLCDYQFIDRYLAIIAKYVSFFFFEINLINLTFKINKKKKLYLSIHIIRCTEVKLDEMGSNMQFSINMQDVVKMSLDTVNVSSPQ